MMRAAKILITITCAIGAMLATTGPASAFHLEPSFRQSANTGGGGGIYYTGAKRSNGFDCGICHLNAEKRISIELSTALSSGVYTPGLIYPIKVKLVGEHRGLDAVFNANTFTSEIVDDAGEPVGFFAGDGALISLQGEESFAVARGAGEGRTEWEFSWWAPAEPIPATLYLAMLDGDGCSDSEEGCVEPLNDDFATLQLKLCPEGQTCEDAESPGNESAPMACAAATGASPLSGLALLLVLLYGRRARRRTNR